MFHKRLLLFVLLFLFALSVSACAQLIGLRNVTPTLPLPTVTVPLASTTTLPTAASSATPTVTLIPSPTVSAPTLTPPPQSGTCTYRASFVADVNYPDNTVVPAGTTFIKTWRIRNDGTCSWGKAGFALHSAAFVGGNPLGAPATVELAANQVAQGQVVDVSIPFVAPATPGTYTSQWKLRVDNGPLVGVDAAKVPFYARIVVSGVTTGAATRVNFASGATDAQVSGNLNANEMQQFVIKVLQGQTMMLTLSSVNNTARVSVAGASATRPSDGSSWLGTIPATGDYIISVSAGNQPTNFLLDISVPQRITFAPNTTATAIGGVTDSRRRVTYLLRASAGQTMTASIIAAPNTFVLTIYGLADGSPLVNGNMSGASSWSGTLPATEDYVIDLLPVADGSLNYTLQVIVQ